MAASVLGLLLVDPGCLNPRPEEDPSALESSAPDTEAAAPARESCADNPALSGCSDPGQGIDINEAPPADDLDEESGAPPPSATPAPSPDAGVTPAGATSDAGVPLDPADAQAP